MSARYDTRFSDAAVRLVELTQKRQLLWALPASFQEVPMQILLMYQGVTAQMLGLVLKPFILNNQEKNEGIFVASYQNRLLYIFQSREQVHLVVRDTQTNIFENFPNVSALNDLYFLVVKQVMPTSSLESFVDDLLSVTA